MGLITKEVEVIPNGKQIKYYSDLGYDSSYCKSIIVKVEDLPKHSNTVIDCTCDYCEKLLSMKYDTYNRSIGSPTKKVACFDCRHLKIQETNLIRYGVNYPISSNEIREKAKRTYIERYGVDNPFKSEEFKEKIRETNLQKYGVPNPLLNKEIYEKSKQTKLAKYGFEYPLQVEEFKSKQQHTTFERYGEYNILKNKDIKNKIVQTMRERYGVDYPSQNPEIRSKMINSFYNNQSIATSTQQIYLGQLYGMEINYPILRYNVDLFDKDNNIIIGYDGGGHWLSVEIGRLSQEKFDRNQMIKEIQLRKAGYKIIRIISRKDKLPSDEILLQMLEDAKQYFSDYPEHSWIHFDIDNENIRNAESKDGVPYFYGQLRHIKKQQLESA